MDEQEKLAHTRNPYRPAISSAEPASKPLVSIVVFCCCAVTIVLVIWSLVGLTPATLAGTAAIVLYCSLFKDSGLPLTITECWVCIAILWILWGLLMPSVEMTSNRRRTVPPQQTGDGTENGSSIKEIDQ